MNYVNFIKNYVITATAPARSVFTLTRTSPVVPPVSNETGIFAGLAAGDYEVTVNSATECISPATSVTILEQALKPVQPLVEVVPPTCFEPGSATITNYNAAYTYTFSPTGPIVGAGGVIAGFTIGQSYTVTATNDALCVSPASAPFMIEIPECDLEYKNGETVFARGNYNECFLTGGFNRWGWTNKITATGTYEMPLWSGGRTVRYKKGNTCWKSYC